MTLHNSLHTGSTAHPVLSALDARLAQAGLIAPDPATGVRLGVLFPEIGGFAVTGTSSTSPWQYSVPGATFVMSKGALDGPHVGANDAPVPAPTIVPPGSNSRYDAIYAMQQDADATISPDASTLPVIGVANGTAAASPTIPAIPAGAYLLAHALVSSTATGGTSGAGVTITQDWQWTTTAGSPIPVRTQAERDAITWPTAAAPCDVLRLDTGATERNRGSGWVVVNPTPGSLLLTPTSVAGTGVSLSGSTVIFTSATAVSVNGVFTTANDVCVIEVDLTASPASTMKFRLRASGADRAGATDYVTGLQIQTSSITAFQGSDSSWPLTSGNGSAHSESIKVYAAAAAAATRVRWDTMAVTTGPDVVTSYEGAGHHGASAASDGFTIFPASGAITGKLRIYGMTAA